MERRVTLRDVAEAAGVSKTTAVFVLNERPNFSVPEETRRRVQSAARNLGYRRNGLAAALSRGKTGSLGLVIPTRTDQRDPTSGEDYLLGILLGATRAAAAAGLRLTTISYATDQPLTAEVVTDQRVDGLILVGIMDEDFTRAVYATGFPCVTLGSGYAERRVTADNRGGAVQAVEHLIELGHQRIAHFGMSFTVANTERQQGWRETLERHHLPAEVTEHDLDTMVDCLCTPSPDRPTAVFCHNDARASQVLRAARRRGLRIPDDLSVVGFDGGLIADVSDLTSVRNPLHEQAALAVEWLLKLSEGENPPAPPPVPTKLIVRYTTAPPSSSPLSSLLLSPISPSQEVLP
jgi:DNA-binding LacI/PurR family transcriptional regulator